MKKGYVENIEKKTIENENFREVLFTTDKSQLVVMSLLPREEIGEEVHDDVDQFLRIESGEGKAVLDGEAVEIIENSAIVVPAGTRHNIINTSLTEKMKLYTIYTPPNHKSGTIHKTKSDAEADESEHH